MSSIYINEFFRNASRKQVLKVIDDLETGKSLTHFKNKWIEDYPTNEKIDWKKRYVSSNYINSVLSEYMDYVQPIEKTSDNSLSKPFDPDKKKVQSVFFRQNNWNSLIKNIAYNRKKNGDVYLYWFIDEWKDEETGKNILYPKFILLESSKMEIKLDKNRNIFAYVYQDTINFEKEMGNGEFTSETVNVKWVLQKGKVDIYENGVKTKTISNRIELKDHIPVLHFQFLVDVKTKYSIIPIEPLIDITLNLDRVETQISYINQLQSAPQIYVIDGVVDPVHTRFGANGIMYVDTSVDENAYDDDNRKKFQAKVGQVEIKNQLRSLTDERDSYIENLYSKANLISPKMYLNLAKSNSSKVLSASRKDLEQELRNLYEELSDKFIPIFKILYELNELEYNEEVTLVIPEYIIDETVYDKYTLKAQKINLGELTIHENLRELGMNEDEIKRHVKELNEEIYGGNDDITVTNKNGVPSQNNSTEFKQVDNISKQVK